MNCPESNTPVRRIRKIGTPPDCYVSVFEEEKPAWEEFVAHVFKKQYADGDEHVDHIAVV